MSEHFQNFERRLIGRLQEAGRGSRRNGVFALWLTVRSCSGMLPPRPLGDRVHQRRLELLQRRLTSLSLPASFKQALRLAVRSMSDRSPESAFLALHGLTGPVRDTLGDDVREELGRAIRSAEETVGGATESW